MMWSVPTKTLTLVFGDNPGALIDNAYCVFHIAVTSLPESTTVHPLGEVEFDAPSHRMKTCLVPLPRSRDLGTAKVAFVPSAYQPVPLVATYWLLTFILYSRTYFAARSIEEFIVTFNGLDSPNLLHVKNLVLLLGESWISCGTSTVSGPNGAPVERMPAALVWNGKPLTLTTLFGKGVLTVIVLSNWPFVHFASTVSPFSLLVTVQL